MKKILLALPIILLLFTNSFSVNAQTSGNYIQNGITSDGTAYVVYEVDTTMTDNQIRANSMTVVREFHYSGIVQPPTSQIYKENINGTIYGGTLYLQSFTYEDNLTIAAYRGTLIALN